MTGPALKIQETPAGKNSTGKHLRSKAVEEMILKRPDFLSRYAFLFLLSVMIVLIAVAGAIRYTKKITIPVLVVPVNKVENTLPSILNFHPANNDSFYAYGIIKSNDAGRIVSGQQVALDFPVYPSKEFGTVTGVTDSLTATPETGNFVLTIKLPDGLITTKNQRVYYAPGLNAQVQVNAGSVSLLKYILGKND